MAKRRKQIEPIINYTKEESAQLVDDLILWMKEKPENFIIDEFLLIEKGIFKNDVDYLRQNDPYFNKMIEQAEAIELTKLQKYAVGDRLNASIAKQILINKYRWL